MSEADLADAPTPPGELQLDPFGFTPEIASRIVGLGGTATGHDNDYVFHTPYVEAEEGPAHFIVRFSGLTAKQGTLVLRVHMLPKEEGAIARLATSDRVALNRLIHHGGEYIVRFEGFHDVTFALYAGITGETDAAAEGLTITLDRPADPTQRRGVAAEARSTDYGREPVREVAHLISMATPTLADPVAQIATSAQLREPTAAYWRERLDVSGLPDLAQWEAFYTLEALRRFGMLQAGAKGLGLGLVDTPIPAALAALGVDVLATCNGDDQGADASALADRLAARAGRDTAAFARHVSTRVAPLSPVPEDLLNHDFVWSNRVDEQLGSVAGAVQMVEQSMACLRPGGLAVHTFGYDPAVSDQRLGSDVIFHRCDAERLELILISRRHDVAQFKLVAPDALLADRRGPPGTLVRGSVFGIIARKPRLSE